VDYKTEELMRLNSFRRNVNSQFGEDGILEKLFDELRIGKGVFCEFGAWDGKRFSNTYLRYENGWKGIYIEGNRRRYAELRRNIRDNDSVDLICAYVRPDGPNSLDRILENSRVVKKEQRLDLLSIDIDSDDLAIWRSLTSIRPCVVVIEFNPTIPLDTDYVNPVGENKGNAARSIAAFAESNMYDLVATTHCNLVFVDARMRPANVERLDLLREGLDEQIRFFWGYDGSLVRSQRLRGEDHAEVPALIQIPWKLVSIAQPLPSIFRRYDQSSIMTALSIAHAILCMAFCRPKASSIMAVRIARSLLARFRIR
jgi:hypothetical protein